ncbi:sphingosine-1-phosphate lyase-like protein [Ochromonadaceae sp. CCMP2298]|nr:sphingosine-1-phosphate lyase-like protein [Ochromonadaceae sp. CCMP2298]|mmetsp:Transcript_33034/g.72757  ORF Transcript_33034/g.72757 Transcript_33034/m.72757 type:complete len:555 (+) Transcript_33034:83-1747(+)
MNSFSKYVSITAHVVAGSVALAALNILARDGVSGLTTSLVKFLRQLPAVNSLIKLVLAGEVKDAMKLLCADASGSDLKGEAVIPIPGKGVAPEAIREKLEEMYASEKNREKGKGFAITYTSRAAMKELSLAMGTAYEIFSEPTGSGNAAHEKLVADAWKVFMHTNAINPTAYIALRRFETEVLSMCAWMLNGDGNVAGTLTSGGTESVLMAIKTYRDRARKLCPHITKPNVIAPTTIHPAFEKAAHYFGVEIIHIGLTADFRVDVDAVAKAINRDTILICGSAPQYCHGVVDPIERLSDLAIAHGLPLHVDACFGGFMLPWLEKLGCAVPLWDFRVKGVTSISADIHKYGYCPRGASVVLYRNAELRAFQFFAYPDWPGGLFGSPAMAGSRPGGMIAAAWTAMVAMGQDGYMNVAREVLGTTTKILDAVDSIKGIRLVVKPDMTALAIMSDDPKVHILALADVMESKGWQMERNQNPDSLHMSVGPLHTQSVDQLIVDMQESVEYVYAHPELTSQGTVGMYGMVAKIPDNTIVTDFILGIFSALYKADSKAIMD